MEELLQFADLLSPCTRNLLEKLRVSQQINRFPAIWYQKSIQKRLNSCKFSVPLTGLKLNQSPRISVTFCNMSVLRRRGLLAPIPIPIPNFRITTLQLSVDSFTPRISSPSGRARLWGQGLI